MELVLHRTLGTDTETIGRLYIDGKFFCYTLEDAIRDIKIKHETCIPYGRYLTKVTHSPAFRRDLPLVYNNRSTLGVHADNGDSWYGIRIHNGNYHTHTSGCILVGYGVRKEPDDTPIKHSGQKIYNWVYDSVAATNDITRILATSEYELHIVYDLEYLDKPKVYEYRNPMMKDSMVLKIQQSINQLLRDFEHHNPQALDHILTEDGIYGPLTRDTVKAFQQINGLEVTGKADETFINLIINK